MNWRYLASAVTAFAECFLLAGLIFGWTSISFTLHSLNYFCFPPPNSSSVSLTSSISISQSTITSSPSQSSSSSTYFQTTSPFLSRAYFSRSPFTSPAPSACPDQDQSLSLAFSIATFTMAFSSLPLGWFFDTYGTWAAQAVTLVLYCGGAVFIACSSPGVSELVYPGTIGIAVGGAMMLMTNLQVGNLFPRYQATFITACNGAFDSSPSIAILIKFLWQAGIPLQYCFAAISLAFPLLIIRCLVLLPRYHIPLPAPPGYRYGLSLSFFKRRESPGEPEGKEQAEFETQQVPSPSGSGDASLWASIFSRLYLSHFVWLSLLQFRHFLYISTLHPWLSTLSAGDVDMISWYTTLFAITQSCAWLCAPWNGCLIDVCRQRLLKGRKDVRFAGLGSTIPSLGLTSLLGIAFAGVAAIPKLQAQGLAFCLQVMSMTFIYGGNAAFIAIVFPSAHFAKLIGLMMSASAIPLLLQLPLVSFSKEHPHMVNLITFVLCWFSLIHPMVVYRHYRKLSSSQANNADEAMPEHNPPDV
uniref:Solute carrier family 43 member 3 n=1 Tax=Eptatretus burgeri TaxID=7764 RepID=A0A8C4X1K8_EPTBU